MGYHNLNIDVYLTAATLRPYINITYDTVDAISDNILNKFSLLFKNGTLPSLLGYTLKYSKFLKWIGEDQQFAPPGSCVKVFAKHDNSGEELFHVTSSQP